MRSFKILFLNVFSFEMQRYPFDMNHPIGYLLDVVIHYTIFSYIFVLVACLFSLGLGCFCFSISMVDDIKDNLNSFNEQVKTEENPTYILEQFTEFIKLHTNVKQLSCLPIKSMNIPC